MAKTKADKTREDRTGKVLTLATDEAQSVHGNAAAKTVSVTASLSVTESNGDKKVTDGAKATVALETTHSES